MSLIWKTIINSTINDTRRKNLPEKFYLITTPMPDGLRVIYFTELIIIHINQGELLSNH